MLLSNRLGKIILAAAAVLAVSVVSAQAQVVVAPAGGTFADVVGNPQWQTSVYTQTATGGTAPFTFTISAGTLPPGTQLLANGQYIGSPAVTGNFTWTVKATSSTGTTGTVTYVENIFAAPVITQTTLPTLTVGAADDADVHRHVRRRHIVHVGHSSPGGTLPAGLTLNGVNNNVV